MLLGNGAKNEHRKFFSEVAKVEGKVERTSRRLGSQLHHELANDAERKVRVAAMRRNWLSMTKLWKSKDVTLEATRTVLTVFCSRVREAGISGLEAYVLYQADASALDRTLLKLGRDTQGKLACTVSQDNEGNYTYKLISNFQVWRIEDDTYGD